jgi:hypothetical protein
MRDDSPPFNTTAEYSFIRFFPSAMALAIALYYIIADISQKTAIHNGKRRAFARPLFAQEINFNVNAILLW